MRNKLRHFFVTTLFGCISYVCVAAIAGCAAIYSNQDVLLQITKANTTYVISRDYDLKGQTLVMPKDCILKFRGGKLLNGKIKGNNTVIDAKKQLVLEKIEVSGTWINKNGYPEWFGATNNPSVDSKMAIQKALDVSKTCRLTGKYYMAYDTPTGRGDAVDVCAIAIKGQKILGTPQRKIYVDAKYCNTERTSVFWVGDSVIIDGVNIEYLHEDHTGWTGIQDGVYRVQGGNVSIQNTTLRGAMAAWINLEGATGRRNFVIKNNFVHDCDCGLIIQGNRHRSNEIYDMNLVMENNVIEKENNRHSEFVSFWGGKEDNGKVYYANVTIRNNKFIGGYFGGCITGHPTCNGLKNVTICDNVFYDCGGCVFYNAEGLIYVRNYVAGSTFVERQIAGIMGSYPDLSFSNCKECVVDDISCFGMSFTDCKNFRIGRVKQTLDMDKDNPFISQMGFITDFIGIRAENSTVTIDELTVNPFKDNKMISDKCKYYIFKANKSSVQIGTMRSNIPVQDSKKLLNVGNRLF